MSLTIGLVGNPNCGKTTVFNALAGARQRVGNWPGVTVERKSGFFKWNHETVEVVDLPGTYSLVSASEASSIDERIACEFILDHQADVIVNILDASNLERHLYLTTQLIEMRVPMVIAVNMMDVARARQMRVLLEVLDKELGYPVVALEAHKGRGIKELKQAAVIAAKELVISSRKIPYLAEIEHAIERLCGLDVHSEAHSLVSSCGFNSRSSSCGDSQSSSRSLSVETSDQHDIVSINPLEPTDKARRLDLAYKPQNHDKSWLATRLLENDVYVQKLVHPDLLSRATALQNEIRSKMGEDADILLADARYRFAHDLVSKCVEKTKPMRTWTSRIDDIVLNRILGIPIFLGVMYCLFLFAINIGGAFQDFFDIGSDTLFVQGFSHVLTSIGAPTWVIALLANGIGKGITTTVTFIPVIGAMFLALAFLEDSGYMARAAFVIDRLMRALGLPGKSFVPMIIGFGCNVPAVMAARTLENKRDRILTVMMSPFMSCGARLAIYAVFTAAFFPVGGQNVVFALYLIGIIMAMLTGLLLRKTLLKGEPAPLIMELPAYHVPHVKTLALHAWQRLKGFVFRAGKLIVPICVLIGVLNSLNVNGVINSGEGDTHSVLSLLGQWFTPIFAPMGIHQDNWPATVGLMTGVLAKEVVIGTLNSLYSQLGQLTSSSTEIFNFWGGLHDALISIPNNLAQLGSSLGNPVLAKAPVHTLSQNVYGLMYEKFDGQLGAMAYLLFVLLYFPCVSTIATMARELNRGWAWFSVIWSTIVAYGAAVGFYQLTTVLRHPMESLLWVVGIVLVFVTIVIIMRRLSRENSIEGRYEFARN